MLTIRLLGLACPLIARDDADLSGAAKLVLALIHGNPGHSLPIDAMCAALRLGQGTVTAAVRELEPRKLIAADRPKVRNAEKRFTRATNYRSLVSQREPTAYLSAGRVLAITCGAGKRSSKVLLLALLNSTRETPLSAPDIAASFGVSERTAQYLRSDLKRVSKNEPGVQVQQRGSSRRFAAALTPVLDFVPPPPRSGGQGSEATASAQAPEGGAPAVKTYTAK